MAARKETAPQKKQSVSVLSLPVSFLFCAGALISPLIAFQIEAAPIRIASPFIMPLTVAPFSSRKATLSLAALSI